MKVLVTGGTGAVGRATVRRLAQAGHAVTVIGRTPGLTVPGADYRACDIMDAPALCAAVKGMDAVVHLAAIANPAMASGPAIFEANCAGPYNVFAAAAAAGIHRVVLASSINALGFNFGCREMTLQYLPVDEKHPPGTTDPYSYSKQVMEDIAAYFWRRDDISSVSLRLPFVYDVDGNRYTSADSLRSVLRGLAETHGAFLRVPRDERERRARDMIAAWQEVRASRAFELPFDQQHFHADPLAGFMVQRSNFWALVDSRDCAQAVERGLTGRYEGAHPLFINDAENVVGLPSRELAATFYPGTEVRDTLQGTGSLVSIQAARDLLGFEPGHSWRELLQA